MKKISIILIVIAVLFIVRAALSQVEQQGAFRPSTMPTTCASMEHAITEMKYFDNTVNQRVVATWNDPRTHAYSILLYYVKENALEIILIDPSRKLFCVVTGGPLNENKAFPGLLELLTNMPL